MYNLYKLCKKNLRKKINFNSIERFFDLDIKLNFFLLYVVD